MEVGRIDPDRMDDSDSENTISDAKSISENDTFDENHRLGVQNLRSEPRSLSEPVDFSLRSLKARAMRDTRSPSVARTLRDTRSPSVARTTVREGRSPSKVYEDTLVIERKIRGFGLFSEELEWILMALLKDNEELKNIVKVGFKEVEREMQDMDDVMKKENSARAKEVSQMQHLLNEQRDEVETRLGKVEKDLKSQMSSMAEQCDDALKNMRIKFMKEIDETLEERIPDINGRLNDMTAKMSLVFSDQREKVDKLAVDLSRAEEDIKETLVQDKAELTRAIETNLEDTTKAVVMLRKELNDGIGSEKEQRKSQETQLKANLESLQVDLKTEMESKQNFLNSKLTSELDSLKESLVDNCNSVTALEDKTQEKLSNLKDEMDSINCAQESRFDDKFENVREALAKTIEKTSEDMNQLDRTFNEETLKMKKDISANEEKIAKEAESVESKQRNIIERLNTQEENQSKTNDIIKANFDTIKTNFEANLRETDQALKEEMENLKTDINTGIKDLGANVERETLRLTAKQDAEKMELLAEVKAVCGQLEVNVTEQMKRSSNELQTLDYRLSNERKEAELRVKEDASGEPPSEVANNLNNPFVRMFNHLKEMMEKQKEKAATDSEEAAQKLGHLEEDLRRRQEEERQRLAETRGEERREAEAERERAAREAEQVVERMEARVAAVQDDVKQRQLQGEREAQEVAARLEEMMAGLIKDAQLPLSVLFSAYRDADYLGKGEENLAFSGTTIDTAQAFDARCGVFTVPVSGIYLLSLHLCSQDRKKVFVSLRQNDQELASMYDQNHMDNHKSSMVGQMVVASLAQGDKISVYLYTSSSSSDKKSNHFTQFNGILLRPSVFLQ